MRKGIPALGAILLEALLLFTGSFFLYWGLWNYFYGSALPGGPFGIMMAGFGIFVIALGIILALLKIHGFLKSRSAERIRSPPSLKQLLRNHVEEEPRS